MTTHIDLQIGSRVRFTHNISVACGLYNGQMATVHGFVYKGAGPTTLAELKPRDFGALQDDGREMPIILLQIDEGFKFSCSAQIPRLIPLQPIMGQAKINGDYDRWQYPILLAHARTAHSIQGFTAHGGIVAELDNQFFGGNYVALGRATALNHVLLLNPAKLSHFTSFATYRLLLENTYKAIEEIYPQSDD